MQNRLYFISPINDRAFFIRRQQNNEQAKGWLDSDRGEKWEDRSSIIESGAIEKQNRPRLLGEVQVCFMCFTSIRPSNLASTGKVHKAEFIQSVDRFGVFKTARVF